MSNKRQATSDLNHDNWDREDSPEKEEMGCFKAATPEVLEKRVIRTAKRRFQIPNDEPKKSVFSGFGGFNKSQPSSFDFLANLTNGSKNVNDQANTSESSSLFSKTTVAGSINSDTATSPTTTNVFASSPTQATSSLFGNTAAKNDSPFTAAKSSVPGFTLGDTNKNKEPSPSVFGLGTKDFDSKKSVVSKIGSPATKVETGQTSISITVSNDKTCEMKEEETNDENKIRYYTKLKGLNESVSEWIKKHVEATPLCILSPIFKDYEKHLKEIQSEFNDGKQRYLDSKEVTEKSASSENTISNNLASSKPSIFGISNSSNAVIKGDKQPDHKATEFSFGIKPSTPNTPTNAGFTFGIKPSLQVSPPLLGATNSTKSSLFSLSSNTTTTNSNGGATFSFGLGKPFSFSSNVQVAKAAEPANENEDEEPPKVEFTPVVEENSVYDKRCKIFVKKDGTFADKGIGTLYIKKVEDSEKHQLLVRANTNLGNVLLNLILTSSIPTQRLGKNNVMMACIPTPEYKPPPTPILIRVKSAEEADELLDTLNKYKT